MKKSDNELQGILSEFALGRLSRRQALRALGGRPRALRPWSHASNVGATWSSSQTAAFGNTDGSGWAGSKLATGNGLHACLDASALWHTAVARAANAWPTAGEDLLLQAVSGEIKETIAMTGRARQPPTIPPPFGSSR